MSNEFIFKLDEAEADKLFQLLNRKADLPLSQMIELLLNQEEGTPTGRGKKARQLRYYMDELSTASNFLPYLPQTIHEKTRLLVIIYQLMDKLTLSQLKRLLTEDKEFSRQIGEAIIFGQVTKEMASYVVTDRNKVEFIELYNHLAPRLVEIIFNLIFSQQPENAVLFLDLGNAIPNHQFVAYISDVGTIVTSIYEFPIIPDGYSRIDEIRLLNKKIEVYLPKETQKWIRIRQAPENTYDLAKVLNTYVTWLYNFILERHQLGSYDFHTAMVRNHKGLRLNRLNLILEWLIQQAHQTGDDDETSSRKKWSFAVALRPNPNKPSSPRYQAELNVVACSRNAPYWGHIPLEEEFLKQSSEFYSSRAFNLGQIITTGINNRKFIKPELFENEVDSAICVPTVSESDINSILYVASKEPQCHFSEEDEVILALFGQITGELLSSNYNHRDSNTSNFKQILDNHLIISPVFSGFYAPRRCRQDLVSLWEQMSTGEKFIFIEIDFNQSRNLINNYRDRFNSQYAIDDFFKTLGSSTFPRLLEPFLDVEVSNPVLERIKRRIYHLSLDRFAFILPFIDHDLTNSLNEVVYKVGNQNLDLWLVSIKIVALIIEKTSPQISLNDVLKPDNRFIFSEIGSQMNILTNKWKSRNEQAIEKLTKEERVEEKVIKNLLEGMVSVIPVPKVVEPEMSFG